jgi:hypothetical protein
VRTWDYLRGIDDEQGGVNLDAGGVNEDLYEDDLHTHALGEYLRGVDGKGDRIVTPSLSQPGLNSSTLNSSESRRWIFREWKAYADISLECVGGSPR